MHHRGREDREIIGEKLKGSYILLINLPRAQTITIGNLPDVPLPRGYYAYVGSALGGINARISHHLKRNKKPHWHIDYLLQKASITDIVIGNSGTRSECAIARALSAQFNSIPGFGSSDCHCRSHLFFATGKRQMKATIVTALESLAIPPKLMRVI